ncbi:MAG TPA: hypothetical protein VK186_16200 [Candidatus Deferrimicrobium sp.]|nr:hypothetical protein [Candidatus Deferrimicrobium sp.]
MKKDDLLTGIFIGGIILITSAFSHLAQQEPPKVQLKHSPDLLAQLYLNYFELTANAWTRGKTPEKNLKGQLKVVDQQAGKVWKINNIMLPSEIEIIGNGKCIKIPVEEDGTFKSEETIPTGHYAVICKLQYYDYIPFDNDKSWGGVPAPAGGKLIRQTVRKMPYVKIDEENPILDIEFPLPIFLVHGIRCGWSTWNTWVSDFLNQGYIVYTPNHDFQGISKKEEALQLATQFFANLDHTDESKYIGLFEDTYPDVYFICHSEGGIVTRALVNLYPAIRNRIKFIFTLGTPHSGTDIPFASLFGLDKRSMVFNFNRTYPTFNGVPVYAISGHGMTSPYIDFIASPHDGIVYWNDILMINKSPFAICNTLDPECTLISSTEIFKGYSNFYTENGHHFPFNHSNLVEKEGGSILRNAIIRIMGADDADKDAHQDNFNYSHNSQNYLKNILSQTFSLSRLLTKRFLIDVSAADLLIINAMGIKGDITVTLIDPDGKRITKNNCSSYLSAAYSCEIMSGIGYQISTPKPGQWTIEVTAGDVDDTIAIGASEKSNWIFLGYTD